MLPLFLWAFVGLAFRAAAGRRRSASLALIARAGREGIGAGGGGRHRHRLGASPARAGAASRSRGRRGDLLLRREGRAADVRRRLRLHGALRAIRRRPRRPAARAVHAAGLFLLRSSSTPSGSNFLFWTLAPIGFLPLFHWRAALAALPPYLMLFLSEGDQRVRIVFHYGIEPGSALFWALPFGLAAFVRRFGWQRAGVWMLLWAIAGYGTGELARARSYRAHRAVALARRGSHPMPGPERADGGDRHAHPAPRHARTGSATPTCSSSGPRAPRWRCVVTDLKPGTNWPLGSAGVAARARGAAASAATARRGAAAISACTSCGSARCLRCVPDALRSHSRFADHAPQGFPDRPGRAGGRRAVGRRCGALGARHPSRRSTGAPSRRARFPTRRRARTWSSTYLFGHLEASGEVTYLDIGAYDPVYLSNTYFFYGRAIAACWSSRTSRCARSCAPSGPGTRCSRPASASASPASPTTT